MTGSVCVRNWSRTIMGALVAAAIGVFFLAGAIIGPDRDTLIGVTLIEAIVIFLLVRIVRAGVLITDDRIVVRNLLRSHVLPWSRISAFSPAWDDPKHHSVGVFTAEGRRVSCLSLRGLGGWALLSPPRFVEDAAANTHSSALAGHVERMLARRAGVPQPIIPDASGLDQTVA